MKRNCPSLNSMTRRNVSRQARGASNGISPSKISIKANPASRMSVTKKRFV